MTFNGRRAMLAAALAVVTASCGTANGEEKSSAPVNTEGSGALVAPINQATSQSCASDRQNLVAAVEIYFAETGSYPAEADLVTFGYFDAESEFHDLLPDGTLVETALCAASVEGNVANERPELDCDADKESLLAAIEAYKIEHSGAAPTAESDVVGLYVAFDSPNYDLGPDGSVILSPTSTCPQP